MITEKITIRGSEINGHCKMDLSARMRERETERISNESISVDITDVRT